MKLNLNGKPKKMVAALAVLMIALLGGVMARDGLKEQEDEQARRETMEMLAKLKSESEARKKERDRLAAIPPYPDAMADNINTPIEKSAWLEDIKNRYGSFVERAEIDVLLVPFQVQAHGIERSNRSLMTALLASSIASSTKVADPYAVGRAVGEGERRVDRRAVLALATSLHAKRIVWSYAGHRLDSKLHLYFQIQERDGNGSFSDTPDLPGELIEPLPFSHDIPPVDVFRQNLGRITTKLGYPAPATPAEETRSFGKTIPRNLGEITQETDTANAALRLQFLASLLPNEAERLRERLFERSLLLSWRLPAAHASARILQARAYYGLHMRPAALALLNNGEGNAEKSLRAALNGNLPELDRYRKGIEHPMQRIMAEIDANDIRQAYQSDTVASENEARNYIQTLTEPWNKFLLRRFASAERTKLLRLDNLEILRLLGTEFPAAGQAIDQRLRGNMIAGQLSSEELDIALASYLDPRLAGDISIACCNAREWHPARRDILDFLVESGIANIIYKANRLSYSQGLYQETLDYLNRIDVPFGSHPELCDPRVNALAAIAKQAQGANRQAWETKAIHENEKKERWLKGFQHVESDRPSHVLFPAYAFLQREAPPWAIDHIAAALANASFLTQPLESALNIYPPERREPLLAEMQDRFVGSPISTLLRVALLESQNKNEDAIAFLRQAIANKAVQKDIYQKLGQLLFRQHRYREAAEAFAAYPGMKEKVISIETDNYAYEHGSSLFWVGETGLARRFYEASAASNTGSHSSLASAARLALLDDNYLKATQFSYAAAQRYGSSYRYRDYFSLLHMLGESSAAWTAFDTMVGRLPQPHLWDSALVGHRRARLDEKEIADWAKRPTLTGLPENHRLIQRYLTLAAVTDRTPGKTIIAALDSASQGPQRSFAGQFVEAYAAIKREEYPAAHSLFTAMRKQNNFARLEHSEILPYYAIAAMRAGNPAEVAQLLESISPEGYPIDYWLTRTAFSALSGKDDALEYFEQALSHRVFTEGRWLTVEYELADVAYRLFKSTGNTGFRDQALRIARFNRDIQPWEAWSHALVAVLGKGQERDQALLQAVYLDPQSEWLKQISDKDRREAEQKVAKSPPFKTSAKAEQSI